MLFDVIFTSTLTKSEVAKMRYSYQFKPSRKIRDILRDPEQSRKVVDAIRKLRNNPETHSTTVDGLTVRTHCRSHETRRTRQTG